MNDYQKANCFHHLLIWTYKDDVPQTERARIEAELAALPDKIPALRSVRWGPVVGGRNQAFSHCFLMIFDDKRGLEEYNAHPDHVHFATAFREACATQVVVDFEG